MSNTITYGPNLISIAPDGSTAYDSTADGLNVFPKGLMIKAIKFKPNAANDVCLIRHGSATGPIICWMKDTAGSGVMDDTFGRTLYKPYLDGDEGVSGSTIIIMYEG